MLTMHSKLTECQVTNKFCLQYAFHTNYMYAYIISCATWWSLWLHCQSFCLHYSVFFLAGEFAQHLQRQAKEDFPSLSATLFTDGEVICAQIAGLCHDLGRAQSKGLRFVSQYHYNYFILGHGPFSHLFERCVMKSVKVWSTVIILLWRCAIFVSTVSIS